MFKWFKKEKKKVDLSLEKVPSFLDRELGEQKKKEEDQMRSFVDDIKKELEKLKTNVNELKKEEKEEKFPNIVKDKFCENFLNTLKSIKIDVYDYDSVNTYLNNTNEKMKNTGNISVKEFVQLRTFDKMKPVTSQVKVIERKIKLHKKRLDFMSLKKLENVKESLRNIHKISEKIKTYDKKKKNMSDKISALNSLVEKKKKEVDEIMKKLEKYEDIKKSIHELEKERSITKMKLSTELSGLDRLLRKLQHIDITYGKNDMIHRYRKNPADAFLVDKGLFLKTLLDEIKHAAEKHIVELKNEKVLKLADNIDYLLSVRDEFKELSSSIDDMERRMDEFRPHFRRKSDKIGEIDELQRQLTMLDKTRREQSSEKQMLENQMTNSKSKLETMLSDLTNSEVGLK